MAEEEEKMSETTKLMWAVFGAIIVGFVLVGLSKMESNEQKESAALVRNYFNLQTMATEACPKAIKEQTGEQVFFPSETESDKETYITMKWVGENNKTGGFTNASCKVESSKGGITELIIDGKTIIKR
jgi:hypothetical protein